MCESLVYVVCVCAGHSKAVRDVCFNNNGTQFLSAAYDRYIKLWDTETGERHTQCKVYASDVCIM